MNELRNFIVAYTSRTTCECGQPGCTPDLRNKVPGHTCDLVYFKVTAQGTPDPQELRRLVVANKTGQFGELDPFDGGEHSYLQIGGWIGDQGLALSLMGLGHILGLWKCLTPLNMLPDLSPDLVQQLAGSGMITIQSK